MWCILTLSSFIHSNVSLILLEVLDFKKQNPNLILQAIYVRHWNVFNEEEVRSLVIGLLQEQTFSPYNSENVKKAAMEYAIEYNETRFIKFNSL